MGIISWLVVGAIAGVLAGYLVKGDEGLGLIGRIALGIVGAIVGGFLAGVLLPGSGDYVNGINLTTIITATNHLPSSRPMIATRSSSKSFSSSLSYVPIQRS